MTEKGGDHRPFLARWSERKHATRADAEAAQGDAREVAAPDDAGGAPDGGEQAERTANRAAAEAIDIESLTDKSDYGPFFKLGVPAALKSAALHRLWRSNPVFANLDGLNDYDEDYTFPTTPAGAVRTAWKVGRGLLADDDPASADGQQAANEAGPPGAEQAVAPTEATDDDRPAGALLEAGTADAVRSPDARDDGTGDTAIADEADADAVADAPQPATPATVRLAQRLDIAAFPPPDDAD